MAGQSQTPSRKTCLPTSGVMPTPTQAAAVLGPTKMLREPRSGPRQTTPVLTRKRLLVRRRGQCGPSVTQLVGKALWESWRDSPVILPGDHHDGFSGGTTGAGPRRTRREPAWRGSSGKTAFRADRTVRAGGAKGPHMARLNGVLSVAGCSVQGQIVAPAPWQAPITPSHSHSRPLHPPNPA